MIGYFDVRNGCAGDMIAGSLASCVDIGEIKKQLKLIDFPTKYDIEIKQVIRHTGKFHGIKANQFIVKLEEKENDRKYREIVSIFKNSRLNEPAKEKILKVFETLAKAESKVHNECLDKLHFHAVGQTDALVEVAFSILALEQLGINEVFASPVGVSNIAPATMEMISGIPAVFRDIPFEITTPTGIAIIVSLVKSYGDSPPVITTGYGYGTGTIQTEFPNTVLFAYGEPSYQKYEKVGIIETSVDDTNPVIFEYLIETLYQAGALEVCFFNAITKKSRPLFCIRVLCKPEQKEILSKIIFQQTTTLGIRYREEERLILERKIEKVKTKYGEISIKIGYLSGKPVNIMPEYEDCKKIAAEKNVPVKKIINEALRRAIEEMDENRL
ncbi:MAG: nickel pincer cofactor biosynthesis protein LarC [Candidatus Omnitrophica bacterium]|nr:nickel pincer cofactor biosynthesis protein LarC [Candidatus Omnitrophota bacterium]